MEEGRQKREKQGIPQVILPWDKLVIPAIA